jgi:hypothetical protein
MLSPFLKVFGCDLFATVFDVAGIQLFEATGRNTHALARHAAYERTTIALLYHVAAL